MVVTVKWTNCAVAGLSSEPVMTLALAIEAFAAPRATTNFAERHETFRNGAIGTAVIWHAFAFVSYLVASPMVGAVSACFLLASLSSVARCTCALSLLRAVAMVVTVVCACGKTARRA